MAKPRGAARGTQHEIEARRRKVARLYARKLHQEEIAQLLGVDQSTVSRDIAAIEEEWRKAAAADVGELRARQLAELEEMERACAQHLANATSDRDRARWVAERRQLKARIAAMMGLDAPTQLKHSGEIDLGGGLSPEERRAMAAEIAAALAPTPGSERATDDDGESGETKGGAGKARTRRPDTPAKKAAAPKAGAKPATAPRARKKAPDAR